MSISNYARGLKFNRHAAGIALSWLAVPLLSTPAVHAQVIAIDEQGEAAFYEGPTLTNDDGASAVGEHLNAVAPYSRPSNYIEHIQRAEHDYALPKGLIDAVIYQESRGRTNAVSVKGALGLMQLMPGTAAQLGVNPYLADQNIRGGAMYLRQQIDRFGSIPLGLAAYNAGPGAVLRYGGIPPYRETQNYVATIMRRWQPLTKIAAPAAIQAPMTVALPGDDTAFFIEVTDQ